MDTTITERTSRSSPRQSTKPAAKPKERLQFDFSEEMLQKLDYIMEKTGAATRAEAVRNAGSLILIQMTTSKLLEKTTKSFKHSRLNFFLPELLLFLSPHIST